MTYMKIPIRLIDDNPFQTRESYDKETTAGIMASLGRHGILQPPMLRPNNGRYQLVFGHGRVRAAEAAGYKELDCRVEDDVSDEEMKKYVLQENVLRSDLSEDERMAGLEQYRVELELEPGDARFYVKLHDATGINEYTIREAYNLKEAKIRLKNVAGNEITKISQRLVRYVQGLTIEDQDKLILKVIGKGWSSDTALKVKTAVKDVDPTLRTKLLDEETDLPWKVIVGLSQIDIPENALQILKFITTRRIDEKTALIIIEDAKKGIYPTYETKYSDEFNSTIKGFQNAYKTINTWGFNHYQIVKDHWEQVDPILTAIETRIQEFRRFHRA